ncbi:hypothetical protein ACSDQ9_08265 [Aestuariimicrobium soli]|uniref:hypothetical protein n=1 Tax=Aestuariimicrobium soli TaxID=2035834 RepID=UPI003EBEF546
MNIGQAVAQATSATELQYQDADCDSGGSAYAQMLVPNSGFAALTRGELCVLAESGESYDYQCRVDNESFVVVKIDRGPKGGISTLVWVARDY